MKIGMFTHSTEPRGSVVHASYLSEALARRGHDVTLFALSTDDAHLYRDVACAVRLIPAGPAPADADALIAQRSAELARGLRALAPALDVLHAQDSLVASGLLEARRGSPLGARPLIRTVHHVERFESPSLAACQRRSVIDADVVLSVSHLTAEDVWRSFERPSTRVDNGVDVARFAAPPLSPLRLRVDQRAALGLPDRAFLVLSVGGIEPRKNSLRCLRAMAEVCTQAEDVVWVIAGGSSGVAHRAYVREFEAAFASLPPAVRQRVIQTGTLDERRLTELYLASDVLLCASEHEGFGLCVLEAMAAGVPVIVPRRPPFTEYVTEHAAVFAPPESPELIAAAVLDLYQHPEERRRLADVARGIAASFSWDRCAAQHATVYERALAAVGRHSRVGS